MRVPHPWEGAYPAACRWDAPLRISTLPEMFARLVRNGGARPALRYRDQRLSYTDLGTLVARAAGAFRALGVEKGQAVALFLPNTPWHPVCFFALTGLGARVVHLSALDARRELAHKLADSGARLVVTTDLPTLLPQAEWLWETGAAARVLVGEDSRWGGEPATLPPGLEPLSPLLDAATPVPDWPEAAPGDVALLQYTGGTTGLPKGAMLTHGNLTAAVSIYQHWDDGERMVPGEQRVMGVLPLFHIYALTTVLLRHLADGNEVILHPRFDAGAVLRDIAQHRVTLMTGVPTMWIALLNHPDAARTDFSALHACVSGGAPLPHEVGQKVERLFGQRLRIGWGMTETSPAGTRVPVGVTSRPGVIGVPLPGIEMRIVAMDDPGRALPPGEAGEIAIRGPNVFAGYWNKPADTAAAFRDGWFLTGDLGRLDADGLFSLLDRRKNMIISGGFNVYPAAVESALYEHPDIVEAIVIGIPDAYRGQSAKAFVTLRPGAAELTLEALKAFLHDRLGRHEMPAALEIRDSLPRSPAGKLLASTLIAEERDRAQEPQA
ncbi:AMP-binding protein [Roseomonas haemaphysalidis]|uniref:Long-chain-fatty-acid--CoA ligase n=1 Tax=Roseomonas haemaphysalidis TaxID=2768162 RepID=A0ABS3KK98_9PROT|nr:AMP-binding protein [Roseomonas haemaphysalidis]MBO1077890.1 AMP-binding protein [Roseomonas haemaphysalidis]